MFPEIITLAELKCRRTEFATLRYFLYDTLLKSGFEIDIKPERFINQ